MDSNMNNPLFMIVLRFLIWIIIFSIKYVYIGLSSLSFSLVFCFRASFTNSLRQR